MRLMPGAEVELPPTDPPTDDDRQRVLNLLRGAGSHLGLDEAERRMDAALRVSTRGELALLVWDLPDAAASLPATTQPPTVGAWKSLPFRLHGTVYGAVNGMLVGIWALTDSNHLFWPFFPIAGWGVGLAAHGVVTRAVQRHAYEKEVRRLEKAANRRLASPPAPALAASTRPTRSPHSEPRAAKVVVMFTDVVDSTRLTMVIGDEDWMRVRARYRDLLRASYQGYRGTEVSSQGDGFLARFERPGDAVQCAIDIQHKLEDQRQQVGFAPAVRIGINTGDAIEEEGDVLGTTVNLAARVTGTAEPNEILVTEAVADSLDDRFQLKDGGLREMKGLDRTVHVISVSWK
jgi:class 3 adenylate cyclase